MTTNILAKIILQKRYKVFPEYVLQDPQNANINKPGIDAIVTIGDISFKFASLPYLDLGSEWYVMTGLPFVFALWVTKNGFYGNDEFDRILTEAKEEGKKNIPEIARESSKKLNLDEDFCINYMRNCIYYDLGRDELKGLLLLHKLFLELPDNLQGRNYGKFAIGART
jgi:chorismate dehydratase